VDLLLLQVIDAELVSTSTSMVYCVRGGDMYLNLKRLVSRRNYGEIWID
jgi:hypothetical protein